MQGYRYDITLDRIGLRILGIALSIFQTKAQVLPRLVKTRINPKTSLVKDTIPAIAAPVSKNEVGGKIIEFLSAETYTIKKMDSMDFLVFVGHVKIV